MRGDSGSGIGSVRFEIADLDFAAVFFGFDFDSALNPVCLR